jgi:sulfate adenylyltransferase
MDLRGDWPSHPLSDRQLADLELLTSGAFAPLTGYLGAADCASVLQRGTLADGTPWPRPVTIDVPDATADAAVAAGHLALRDAEGVLLAVLRVVERFTLPSEAALPTRLAGPVELVEAPIHWDLPHWRTTPAALRARLSRPAGEVVGAITGAPPASSLLAHLRDAASDDGPPVILLMIGPVPGWSLDRFALVRSWEAALPDLPDGTILAATPLARTGMGDAALARLVLERHGVSPVPSIPPIGEGEDLEGLRRALERGEPLPSESGGYPPAVEAELRASYPPLADRGLTVFMTGYSGSGKSTVAQALAARLREHGGRSVALLDGDRVRHHLSSELGFSREHRDLNIRRIGFVAAEITRAGGIAICAPIAPYDAVRRDVRAMVEDTGGFVLVHVSTPLEVCEARDRKGLYAKARAGQIAEFTGISDPYEVPTDAELTLDTTDLTVDEAVDIIVTHLVTTGHLTPG